MIKDELKRKIEDNHNHFKEVAENYVNESWGSFLDLNYVDLVLAGIGVGKIIALEEEKRITELEESNKEWQKTCEAKSDTNSQLIEQLADKVEKIADLEAQIEKMKCCGNCIHHEAETYDCRAFCYYEDTCKNHSKWKLKEIKEK